MKLAGSSILTLQALGIAGYFLNILFLAGMMRGRVAGRKRSGAIFIPPLVICLLLLMSITEVCRYVTSDSVPSEFEKFAEKLSAPLCIGIEFVMGRSVAQTGTEYHRQAHTAVAGRRT